MHQIERITSYFFERFKAARSAFLTHIQGITTNAERERYASLILNRLMFIYFIQKKGFLDGDTCYLANRLHLMQQHCGHNTFYRHFLQRLAHQGLGTPERSPELQALLGNVPYLDGDLFSEHEIERNNPTASIADEAFVQLFTFFDTFDWHLDVHSPQNEREINPDILGYIFEKYINQQQMGAYYTKEDITGYIAKNTIIPYLFDAVARVCPTAFHEGAAIWQQLRTTPDRYIYETISSEACLPTETRREYLIRRAYYTELRARLTAGEIHTIDDLITYNLDICQFALDTISHIEQPALLQAYYEQLQRITILDPTCGSGAFLFAALNILEPLYEACLQRMQCMVNDKYPNRRYFILKSIITNNLYGVDIMEEATEICKLRLFLKLVAQVEHIEDIEALPNINHNIRTGNALIGFTSPPHELLRKPGPDPHNHPTHMRAELDRNLAAAYDINPANTAAFDQWRASHQPFHWCVEFAEIIKNSGFNVIIGNPPYVEYNDKQFPYTLRNFATHSCANLYPFVIERSHQLLSPHGRHGMILPLAAFATRNMIPLIEGFHRWFPSSWLSFYHFRPSMLFSGRKVASIPTTIYLARADGPERRFSTHLAKWSIEHRDLLFSRLTYCQITAPRDLDNRHYYPKFGRSLENTIMQKVLRQQKVGNYLASTPNENTMFYRSAGGLYWKVFINFSWPYQTTSNKQ
ncbi:MAG: hypothetical protein JOZ18_07730, partial [Chloroflexi bacterium]|nr:hypothetical protein [Chloroflexota bacterium]